MSKFGGFLARKPTPANDTETEQTAEVVDINNPLDIDEELFSALGAQLGGANESLRNLLLDANTKIGELDTIKASVNKLVDPVTKALREFEREKSEKINLQTVLNNTRVAYGKLRNEVSDLENKAVKFEKEAHALRQELAFAQKTAKTLETQRGEIAVDLAARRAQIADLEARLAQETTAASGLREENRRYNERQLVLDKRIVALETELNNARQKLVMTEDEKRTLQSALDKSIADTGRLSRRLAEAETSLTATQGRLRHVEANFAELNTERARLAATLDDINERHSNELATQRMRFEALQARANSTDRLLIEARDHLTARADELRTFDRRTHEIAQERDALANKVAALEAERLQRESQLREIEQAHDTLIERSGALAKAFNGKENALARAEEAVQSLHDRVAFLEKQLQEGRGANEQQIADLTAALQREKMERAVVEGALEAGRKDFARLMREVMALQRQRNAQEPAPTLRSANAA
ncbi:MAG: hypothetical protein JO205_13700 [Pseudolabrys sp.]|nr:hypothetical protein [Pseudolabrys sp.]